MRRKEGARYHETVNRRRFLASSRWNIVPGYDRG
jgi:hypothetical protein